MSQQAASLGSEIEAAGQASRQQHDNVLPDVMDGLKTSAVGNGSGSQC